MAWYNNQGGKILDITLDGDDGQWFLTISDEDCETIFEAFTSDVMDLDYLMSEIREAM